MKKCLFIILIFIFASGAYAQQFKLIGGLNISSYSHRWQDEGYWAADADYFQEHASEGYWAADANFFRSPFRYSKTGFLGGFGVEFPLNKTIAIELEGFYFQKGSYIDYWGIWAEQRTEAYNMKGISFPLLVKAKFLPQPFPYIIGGGEFLFILSHSRTITVDTETKEDLLERTKRFDLGLVLGIGFEMKVLKVPCFLEGRYNLGQRNLHTPNYYDPYPPTIKASALQILAGFKI